MSQKKYLEKLIINNDVEKITNLLKTEIAITRILSAQDKDIDIIKTMIDNKRYELLNLFGQYKLLKHTNINTIQYVLTKENFNEKTKLKYLQLLHYWGVKAAINLDHHGAYIEKLRRTYTILEYAIEKDYLEIFTWLLKINPPKKLPFENSIEQFSLKSEGIKIATNLFSKKTVLRKNKDINGLTEEKKETLLNDLFLYWFEFSLNEQRVFERKFLSRRCEILIENGYDINLKNKEGQTILHALVEKLPKVENEEPVRKKIFTDIVDFIKYIKTNTDSKSDIRNQKNETPMEKLRKLRFNNQFKMEMVATFLK